MQYLLDALKIPDDGAQLLRVDATLDGMTLTAKIRHIVMGYINENAEAITERNAQRDRLAAMAATVAEEDA